MKNIKLYQHWVSQSNMSRSHGLVANGTSLLGSKSL